MKLTIIGAGGVRTPHLVKAVVDRSRKLGINEIALMDLNARRLNLLYNIILDLLEAWHQVPRITLTTDAWEALKDAQRVVFTIRVGHVEARNLDEKIPLKYGVIGQETTGPGGFSMALRTTPAILEYIRIIEEVAPNAWVLNLTNPAGLITQAVHDYGFKKIVGICDTPSALFADVAAGMALPLNELWFEYFGINHLGWIKRILHRGRDITGRVLANDKALLRHGGEFIDPDFIRTIGMIPNEYLMFYYKHSEIVARVQKNTLTRAQIVADLDRRLFSGLEEAEKKGGRGAFREVYRQYSRARDASYMLVETETLDPKSLVRSLWEAAGRKRGKQQEGPTGYAKIALRVLSALAGQEEIIVVNTINNGAILPLNPTDVVELPCYVHANGIHPLPVANIPEESLGLLQAVKNYERLTVAAIRERSYKKALLALTAHPLVPDAFIAKKILDDFRQAHFQHFPF